MKKIIFLSILTFALVSCSSGPTTSRVAIDEEQIFNSNLQANDLRATVNKMARSLAACRALNPTDGSQPKISFTGIEDKTYRGVDTYNLQSNIRKLLLKNGSLNIVFLDRSAGVTKRILAENRLKQDGTVTGQAGKLAGADYLLGGYLFEDRQVGTKNRTSYYRLSFRLTDVSSGAVVWEDDYELKRIE